MLGDHGEVLVAVAFDHRSSGLVRLIDRGVAPEGHALFRCRATEEGLGADVADVVHDAVRVSAGVVERGAAQGDQVQPVGLVGDAAAEEAVTECGLRRRRGRRRRVLNRQFALPLPEAEPAARAVERERLFQCESAVASDRVVVGGLVGEERRVLRHDAVCGGEIDEFVDQFFVPAVEVDLINDVTDPPRGPQPAYEGVGGVVAFFD